jgi:hypothetical protein
MSSVLTMNECLGRDLALELVRVTEAAALAAGRWMGRGQKDAGDEAAVHAMRAMLRTVDINGVVVIGEGEKDEAPMLFNGEAVRSGGPGGGDQLAGSWPTRFDRRNRCGASRYHVVPRSRLLYEQAGRRTRGA